MAEQIGAKIKDARQAAGMTQKELAEAVDGLSATKISEAERGLRELSDEELAAIAKATGSETLLGEAKEEAPETSAEEVVAEMEPADQQDEDLLSAAAGALGNVADAVKKGENPLDAVKDSVEDLDTDAVVAAVESIDVSKVAGVLGSVANAVKKKTATK